MIPSCVLDTVGVSSFESFTSEFNVDAGGISVEAPFKSTQSEEAGESSSIPGQILSAALSHSRDLLAICDDYKALKVWNLSNASKE